MENVILIMLSIIATLGAGGTYLFNRQKTELEEKLRKTGALNLSEEEAIKKASEKAKVLILEAEKEANQIKQNSIAKSRELRIEIEKEEKRLDEREKQLLTRSKDIDERFNSLEKKERALEQAKRDVKSMRDKIATELEAVARMTVEEAKKELISQTEEELKEWVAKSIREAEFKIQSQSEDRAREILIDVMQKSATDYVSESTATTIDIESEELKGKIIGKEGRNIRTFERLTGVDIIVDEAPNQVTLSCFDPIRREVAALALQKLLKDGRVHPGSIEETIKNIKTELAREIKRTGEKMAYDAGFNDLPQEVIKLLGRFKYRYSYGQNLVKHSMEMVNLGAQLASEVGANVELTKKACLLHDIGKVLTHEIEGKPHHHISGDIVRKYLKNETLANAVESHHGDIEPKTLEAVLVQIADAISGARPGARRDNYEDYIKRVKALEDIAKQYDAVKEAYAVHAGREVRVIFRPDSASDDDVTVLSQKIAKEIEETQSYPGSVKVTGIREFRVTEEAK
ncbi:MAG: Ribonuclease Y [candidate division WS6 bacterium OLB20]|uniref:Ribonuclease Y n=1 Tax=candidate division WS6 bacterium OLB20 TaxID=1617426 RepID=A0A136LVX5_9BACT|nr:MAG: Ribonuclease Y [candidate division WS6 bacterium OLB20]